MIQRLYGANLTDINQSVISVRIAAEYVISRMVRTGKSGMNIARAAGGRCRMALIDKHAAYTALKHAGSTL